MYALISGVYSLPHKRVLLPTGVLVFNVTYEFRVWFLEAGYYAYCADPKFKVMMHSADREKKKKLSGNAGHNIL